MLTDINPFIIGIERHTKRKPKKLADLKNVSVSIGGQEVAVKSPALYTDKSYISEEFTKIMDWDILYGLTGNELKVFIYIAKNCLKLNCDYFFFDPITCADILGVTPRTCYNMLNILTDKKAIIKREPKVFWINPLKLYRGSLEQLLNKRDYELNKINEHENKTT